VQQGTPAPSLPPQRPILSADGQKRITVRNGDTLYGLARAHGVSVAALAETNRLMSPSIQVGQTLVLPPGAY
jgi:LysM repeat protein